ncbi:unnamed protein product [Phyllotreta striolata]|uniref:Major facilitator superfamily (MFS) profile domain-containing protein n=1 Tax=Phyllotreta striolata TaxID=444603 RepID=A0A9N9XQ97_PHYSR|nr:unnamed protein product [Phyllotreta striolata]
MTVKSNQTETKITDDDEEKYWPQVVIILISALSGVTDGFFFSWTSPFLEEIMSNYDLYHVTEQQASWLNTIYPLGMIIACPMFSILSDRIGRKRTYILAVIPQISSWILTIFASNAYYFYASRLLAGFSASCYFSVLPNYIGEITNPKVRGTWGNALASSYYIGEFIIHIIGLYFNVQRSAYVCLALPIVFAMLFSFAPESPYFLIMKGREDEAKESLKRLTRKRNVDEMYKTIEKGVQRQIAESGTWLDLFTINSNRKAIIAGAFLRLSQYTSGLAMFLQYIQVILAKSGTNVGPVTGIIFMGINIAFNLLVNCFIVDRFRRRTLYTTSLSGCAVVLYILGTFFYLNEYGNEDFSDLNWLPITLMIIFLAFAASGVCVLPTLMMSELYSAKIKAKAMIVLVMTFSLSLMFTNTLYNYSEMYFGFHAPFFVFAVGNTLALIASFYVIPETKGKTLEEIQLMLKGESSKPKV